MALSRSLAAPRPRTPEDDYALDGTQPNVGGAIPASGVTPGLTPPPQNLGSMGPADWGGIPGSPWGGQSQADPGGLGSQPIDPGGVGMPAPTGLPDGVGYGVSDPSMGGGQPIDPGGVALPVPGVPTGQKQGSNERQGEVSIVPTAGGLPPGVGVGVSDPLLAGGAGPGGPGVTGPGGLGAPGGGQSALNQNVWDRLNKLLNSTPGYDRSSDVNRMQLDVQRANSARASERSRAKLAERAAATGTLSTGGFDTGVQGIYAEQGLDDASFEAQLARDDLQQQRQEISQALQIGAGLLSDDQRNQLTERLGMIDASLRQKGLDLQGTLGRGDLASRLLQILLGDRQSNDRLGFDYTQLQALLNQEAFKYLL